MWRTGGEGGARVSGRAPPLTPSLGVRVPLPHTLTGVAMRDERGAEGLVVAALYLVAALSAVY